MATLDWQLRRTGEVTLVELSVHSEADQRVSIESRLTPVWAPRRQGVPRAGWDGSTFQADVTPDRPLVLGYASPAAPEEPPAEITATDSPSRDGTVTPRDVVRTLGTASPPRDALGELPDHSPQSEPTGTSTTGVSTPQGTAPENRSSPDERASAPNEVPGHAPGTDGGVVDTPTASDTLTDTPTASDTLTDTPNAGDALTDTNSVDERNKDSPRGESAGTESSGRESGRTDSATAGTVTGTGPRSQAQANPVEPTAWFDAVESRLSTIEELGRTDDADEARRTVEDAGGIEAVRGLQAQIDADRRQLREIRRRSETLSEQLSAAELPLATLERIV